MGQHTFNIVATLGKHMQVIWAWTWSKQQRHSGKDSIAYSNPASHFLNFVLCWANVGPASGLLVEYNGWADYGPIRKNYVDSTIGVNTGQCWASIYMLSGILTMPEWKSGTIYFVAEESPSHKQSFTGSPCRPSKWLEKKQEQRNEKGKIS